MASSSLRLGVCNPHPKLQLLLSRERVKLRSSNLSGGPVHLQGTSDQKPFKNLGEKGALAYPWTVQFLGYPVLSQEWVKL